MISSIKSVPQSRPLTHGKVNQMKKLIVCSRESGNTQKVCSYVASNSEIALKVAARTTKEDLACIDVIVLASGVYANHVHKNILRWIDSLEKDIIKPNATIYLFLTWFGRGKSDKAAFNEVKQRLIEKGVKLEDNYMTCFGQGMAVIRSSHPDEEDCKKVLSWANEL